MGRITVTEAEFCDSVNRLIKKQIATAKAHFEEMGLVFNATSFVASNGPLAQFLTEQAHFDGAGVLGASDDAA